MEAQGAMIRRFKIWLFTRFLPAYVSASMQERMDALERENARLCAYIKGYEAATRAQRKIQIKNEVKYDGVCNCDTTSVQHEEPVT